jgi:hypothetical protein
LPAFEAFVDDYVLAVLLLDSDRTHEALADFLPITGVDVHVFAVKAFGTVIGIAGSGNFMSAIFTDKIFNFPLE